MKDMQDHLETLRAQIERCEAVRSVATDPKKRELFGRLAEHHRVLAAELAKAIEDELTFQASASGQAQ
ncbi:hypothetical protein QRQ56_30895 [Bradyrhizobium sp. U531]|uniref:hypothetical protein n=1 Tax=Bradyrhizobium sp. U531 TaxID=3053458 RepID=UPI003F429A41